MNISGIGSIGSVGNINGISDVKKSVSAGNGGDKGFATSIKESVEAVTKLQDQANSDISKALSGEEVSIAEVMVSTLKAEISMQLTMQIRNKVVEAYNEISRMQI
jgi:flagellar hook-basal body complex protein FliE